MNRIDPQAVPGTYRRLGIEPARGYWATRQAGECLACLVGIVAIEEMSFDITYKVAGDTDEPAAVLGEAIGLNEVYAIGLDIGWEGTDIDDTINYSKGRIEGIRYSPEFHQGVEDGEAALEACKAAGLLIRNG